jgi:hypothetical protein
MFLETSPDFHPTTYGFISQKTELFITTGENLKSYIVFLNGEATHRYVR